MFSRVPNRPWVSELVLHGATVEPNREDSDVVSLFLKRRQTLRIKSEPYDNGAEKVLASGGGGAGGAESSCERKKPSLLIPTSAWSCKNELGM